MRTPGSMMAVLAAAALNLAQAQTYVTPMMGGGQSPAEMVHIDIFYDEAANQLHAMVDDSYGTPTLRSLPMGSEFDPVQPYGVLNGKAYNSQYGWNVGGQFAIPPGAAIWIELINSSPGLETYSGWGRFASYAPIFGTAESSRLWKWSGVMVHNTYALSRAAIPFQFASYHVYFGDAFTAARDGYAGYDDATVTLAWNTDLGSPQVMLFGADAQTNGAPLCFLNYSEYNTNSQIVLNMKGETEGTLGANFYCELAAVAVPAAPHNGGPFTNHAALGSKLALQFLSLSGPPQGCLEFWEAREPQPRFRISTGQAGGTNCVVLSETRSWPDTDPYGAVQGRRVALSSPGLYCLQLRVVDLSNNGSGAGAIHVPSPEYSLLLQAGLTVSSFSRHNASTTVTFGGEPGKVFYLERSDVLGATANWQTVAGPLPGTNRLQSLTDPAAVSEAAFFRIMAR